MAEWSGVLYGFYANKHIDDVFRIFQKKIEAISFEYKFNEFNNEKSLFAYKDAEMLSKHAESGYGLNSKGEGCFGVEAKFVDLHGIASLMELDGQSNFDPCDINLIFDDVCYYVLVLPEIVEDSDFCLNIKQCLVDSIREVAVQK
jgi:hypothetical protein